MSENPDRAAFPDWITLKQAALLLNCSIKTIRRRVESGKMKSMVEYRGHKAIRLVSREDVLREAPSFDLILAASQPPSAAGTTLGPVSVDTERMLRLAVSEWHHRNESGFKRTRILFLAGLGSVLLALVAAVFLTADWFYRLNRDDSRILKGELGTLVAGAEARGRHDISVAMRSARTARGLGEASLRELEEARVEIESLRAQVAGLQAGIADLRTLLAATDEARRRDWAELQASIAERPSAPESADVLPAEPTPGPGPE